MSEKPKASHPVVRGEKSGEETRETPPWKVGKRPLLKKGGAGVSRVHGGTGERRVPGALG